MPRLEETHLPDRALLWPWNGRRGADAQPMQSDQVQEIYVRWGDSTIEMLDPHGNRISLDASAIVKQDIAVGSCMWLGRLEEWLGTGSGQPDESVWIVKAADSARDLKGRSRLRRVGLMKFRSKPNR